MSKHIFSKLFVKQDDWIRSMAESWSKISADMRSHRHELFQHLAKIFYWRDYSEYLRGWKTTCRKGFEDVSFCKHNNKFPSFDKVYNEMWTSIEDIFDRIHNTIIKDLNYDKQFTTERELPDILGKSSNFKNFCKDYITELSRYVSTNGGIDSIENSELIDSLLIKYSAN